MRSSLAVLSVGAAACVALFSGCSKSEETVLPPPTPAPATPAVTAVTPASPAPVVAPPPTGGAPDLAPAAAKTDVALANDGSPASFVMANVSAYFYDKDGNFEPKSNQEVVERAVLTYRELRASKHDDSPDWPPLTDLNLLVKYKILKAVPPSPNGKPFVFDSTTRKVSVALN